MEPTVRCRSRSERGTTLLEVLLAASLFLLLGASMLSVLESTGKAAAGDERKQQTLNQVRNALDSMSSDVRSAIAIDGTTLVSDMPWSIAIQGLDRAGLPITLRVSRTSGALQWARTTPTVLTRTLLAQLTNSAAKPMVRYFRGSGVEIVPAVDGANAVRDCTARLRLTLVAPTAGGPDVERSVDVSLPNRQGLPC
jgi:type II secretory pathway pseudopilin PulG